MNDVRFTQLYPIKKGTEVPFHASRDSYLYLIITEQSTHHRVIFLPASALILTFYLF